MYDEAAPLHSPLDPHHSGDEGLLKEINNGWIRNKKHGFVNMNYHDEFFEFQ